jgi:hypothetical protein
MMRKPSTVIALLVAAVVAVVAATAAVSADLSHSSGPRGTAQNNPGLDPGSRPSSPPDLISLETNAAQDRPVSWASPSVLGSGRAATARTADHETGGLPGEGGADDPLCCP